MGGRLAARIRIGAVHVNESWLDAIINRLLADYRSYLPSNVVLLGAGTHVPDRTADVDLGVWLAENGEIEEAARRLLPYHPDCIAYFCTTVSFVRGKGGDVDISDRITAATGLPATTTSTAMIAALRSLNVRRISVASPYMPDVEESFVGFLRAHEFEVLRSVALRRPTGHTLIALSDLLGAITSCDHTDSEAIFVGCTGQRLSGEIDRLERELGKPVLTANQVTVWHALRLLKADAIRSDRGQLMASREASPCPVLSRSA
jgi:maleate isomerase